LSRQETSELRNELLTVYRNVAKLVPAATYEMLASAMAAVMQAGDVAFQEVGPRLCILRTMYIYWNPFFAFWGACLKFHLQVEVMLFLLGALGVGLSDEALNAALQVPWLHPRIQTQSTCRGDLKAPGMHASSLSRLCGTGSRCDSQPPGQRCISRELESTSLNA
jgi:hypothetical protein